MDRRKSPSRAGFTLVEVLVAVLIIATLIAILLPAVRGAFRKAQEAQVAAELNNLATALASFKNTYGDYPPSRVILCEAGYNVVFPPGSAVLTATVGDATTTVAPYNMVPFADSLCSDITVGQLVQRSRLYLRRFWQRVDFDNGTIPFDFNNNGSVTDIITLNGSECLTFFLGGQPINNGNGTWAVGGFSKLPTNPFVPPSANASATNRTVPNYEFNIARLIDQDGDNIPSYMDPLDTTPGNRRAYAYFTSYGTNSYDPNDDNGNGRQNSFEEEDDGMTFCERGFTVGFPTSAGTAPPSAVSAAPNPYCSGSPVTTGGMSWINPNSFQLFSAGADRLWGLGGQYVQTSTGSTGKLPIAPNDPGIVHAGSPYADDFTDGVRLRESDNITNFSGGRID
jgi:prepilin-type N-terminal cleavage/methylation domain-containing protein